MLSAVFREMCKLYGIRRIYTTAYNPRCNGGIERVHQTLQDVLAKLARDDLENWDLYLQPALSAYRTSPHASTGYPPFLFSNGRMPELPSSSAFATVTPETEDDTLSVEYLDKVQQNLRSVYDTTKYNLEAAQAAAKKYFDEHTKPSLFQVGDIVWFKSTRHRRGTNYKLKSIFQGPMRIVHIHNLTAILEYVHHPSWSQEKCHVDKLSMAFSSLASDMQDNQTICALEQDLE